MNELILKLVTMTGCSKEQAENFIRSILFPGIYETRTDALSDLIDFISGCDRE